MNTNDNRLKAHKLIDHIFQDLLPAHGMAQRPEQIQLSHRMLDAMQDGRIALCDAGTGIGKTYAYLAAATAASAFPTGQIARPIIISTSSIALQNAVLTEYLPLLSCVLMADGILTKPLKAVIRKGKSHYVCDERLDRRLRQVYPAKKNPEALTALRTLRETLDMDRVSHLSGYDRERVCVPQVCDCKQRDCRYQRFLKTCDKDQFLFQICNHNLLVADAIHRSEGKRPIFPEHSIIIVDEAHKLPETAQQMLGVTLAAEEMQSHIFPKLIYKRIRSHPKSRFRSLDNFSKAMQDGEKRPMLCHDCEERFSAFESKFATLFLDPYLESEKLKNLHSTWVNYYFLSVAWRVLWDDLYRMKSHCEHFSRHIFEEYCDELGKCLLAFKDGANSKIPKQFKTRVYKLNRLIKQSEVNELAKGCIFGYSVFLAKSHSFSVIVYYAGLVFVTDYIPDKRRYIFLGGKPTLFKTRCKKKEVTEELKIQFCEMAQQYKKVMTPDMRKKISERYNK